MVNLFVRLTTFLRTNDEQVFHNFQKNNKAPWFVVYSPLWQLQGKKITCITPHFEDGSYRKLEFDIEPRDMNVLLKKDLWLHDPLHPSKDSIVLKYDELQDGATYYWVHPSLGAFGKEVKYGYFTYT